MIYIGLPQWQHAAWNRIGLRDLADYSRYFNCVEGNTTFYALPKVEIVQRWRDMTGDDFRFCFKFPSDISHKAALRNCAAELQAFYHCLSPVHQRIGQLWLQLPAAFGPDELARMWQFFESLPKEFTYGVEVRHPAFFAKGDAERALNQGLHQRGINRVILDSRPVHHAAPIPPPCAMRSRKTEAAGACTGHRRPASGALYRRRSAGRQPALVRSLAAKTAAVAATASALSVYSYAGQRRFAPAGAKIWQQLRLAIPDLPAPPDWPEQDALF